MVLVTRRFGVGQARMSRVTMEFPRFDRSPGSRPCLPLQYHPCRRFRRRWIAGELGTARRCCGRSSSMCWARCPTRGDPRGRRYSLAALLAIAILATAAGMRCYAGFATWARTAPRRCLPRLGVRFRRPSEKTFRSVLSRLDAADLDRRLGAYFTALAAEQAAAGRRVVGGRTGRQDAARCASRRSRGRASGVGVRPPRPARPRAARSRREEQRNPLRTKASPAAAPAVRLLVTVDAMHTQRATATLICGTLKSHYLMIVKSNQAKLLARITALPWVEVPVDRHRRRPRPRPPRDAHPEGPHRRARHRIPLRQTDRPDHPRTRRASPPVNAP